FSAAPLSGLKLRGMSLGAIGSVSYTGTITPFDAATGYRVGGGGTLTLANTNALTGAQNVTATNGGTVVLASPNDYTGTTTAQLGTKLVLGTSLTSSSAVSVSDTASIEIATTGTGTSVLKTGALSVAPTAKLNLTNNKVITSSPVGTFTAGAYTDVSGMVDSGRGSASNAQWDGNGIVTTDTRAVNNNDLTSIGVIDASDKFPGGDTATSLFIGQTVLGSDTLVMFTWGGDAHVDGKINIDDYGQIDFNVGSSGSVFGWYNGDFNYDGKINIDDYGIIDFNVTAQSGIFPTGAGGGLEGVAAVPEPGTLGLFGVAAASLLARRRRRQ
ncbi:MAG: PEP-CTERM sorting domain-containing protein, partial [Tepidisphaeraceae bacterium]